MAKLEDLTVPVLRKLIRAYNLHTVIRGYSTMNKTDLINNIKKHFGIIDDTLQPRLHSAFKVNEQLNFKSKPKEKKQQIKVIEKPTKKEQEQLQKFENKLKEDKSKEKAKEAKQKEQADELYKKVDKLIQQNENILRKDKKHDLFLEAMKSLITEKQFIDNPELKIQNLKILEDHLEKLKKENEKKEAEEVKPTKKKQIIIKEEEEVKPKKQIRKVVKKSADGTRYVPEKKNNEKVKSEEAPKSDLEDDIKNLYNYFKDKGISYKFYNYFDQDDRLYISRSNLYKSINNDLMKKGRYYSHHSLYNDFIKPLLENYEKEQKEKQKSSIEEDYEIIEPDIIEDVVLSKSAEGMGFIKCPEREYIFRKNTQFLKIVDDIINTLNKSAYKYAYSSKSKYEKQLNDFFKQYYDELKQMGCIKKDDVKIYTLCIQAGETIPNHLRNLTTGGSDFYPTPSVCVSRFEKEINNGTNILEGTAGIGHILNDIRGIKYKFGDNDYYMMKAVEYDNILASYLTIMNPDVEVGHGDFLKLKPEAVKGVDLIILNPPFTSGSNKNYYFDFLFKALYLLRSSDVQYHPELIFISPPIVNEREVSNRNNSVFYLNDILEYLPKTLLKKYEKEYNFSMKDDEIDKLEFVQGNLLGHCSEFTATKFKASIYSFIGYRK